MLRAHASEFDIAGNRKRWCLINQEFAGYARQDRFFKTTISLCYLLVSKMAFVRLDL